MERAGKVLLRSDVPGDCKTTEMVALGAWPAAVGKKIAARSKPLRLVRGHLVVEVPDRIWQSQLMPLHDQILVSIAKLTGAGLVESIEFRIGLPRRMPARETVAAPERVDDPVLRRIYAASKARQTRGSG